MESVNNIEYTLVARDNSGNTSPVTTWLHAPNNWNHVESGFVGVNLAGYALYIEIVGESVVWTGALGYTVTLSFENIGCAEVY